MRIQVLFLAVLAAGVIPLSACAADGLALAHEAEACGEAFGRIVARVRLWPELAPGETNACRGRFAFDARVKAWRRHDVTAPELVILKPQTVKHDTMVVVMPGGGYNSNYMGVIGANALPVLESGRWAAVLHYRIPRRPGRKIYEALHRRKIPAQLVVYSNASHGLNHNANVRGWERRIIDWIESRGY